MSDTPRTDDELWKVEYTSGICEVVYADLARTLERENAAFQARVKELVEIVQRAQWAIIEHHSHAIMNEAHSVCPYCTGKNGDALLNDMAKATRKEAACP